MSTENKPNQNNPFVAKGPNTSHIQFVDGVLLDDVLLDANRLNQVMNKIEEQVQSQSLGVIEHRPTDPEKESKEKRLQFTWRNDDTHSSLLVEASKVSRKKSELTDDDLKPVRKTKSIEKAPLNMSKQKNQPAPSKQAAQKKKQDLDMNSAGYEADFMNASATVYEHDASASLVNEEDLQAEHLSSMGEEDLSAYAAGADIDAAIAGAADTFPGMEMDPSLLDLDVTPAQIKALNESKLNLRKYSDQEIAGFKKQLHMVFGVNGILHKKIPSYRVRQAQIDFAEKILQALLEQRPLVAEAGTGTGKTFAYLVPALLTKSRCIVTTAGKALQDQLVDKDIPMLLEALNLNLVKVAVLKGRENYLCKWRLEIEAQNEAEQTKLVDSMRNPREEFNRGKYAASNKEKVIWLQKFDAETTTGDISECKQIEESDPIWRRVTCTADSCPKKNCPYFTSDCYLQVARQQALEADIVVVNHHLYMSSMALELRNETLRMLPRADITVFDEAHQVHNSALNFFGEEVSMNAIERLIEEAREVGLVKVKSYADWESLYVKIGAKIREVKLTAMQLQMQAGVSVDITQLENFYKFDKPMRELVTELSHLHGALDKVKELDEEKQLDSLAERAVMCIDVICEWIQTIFMKIDEKNPDQINVPEGQVRWIEMTNKSKTRSEDVIFHTTPLDIDKIFQRYRSGDAGIWVFTSATLATMNNSFGPFVHEIGIENPIEGCWKSPFDYFWQGVLWVPKEIHYDKNPELHTAKVVETVWPLINAAKGRTFILCTSLSAMNRAADLIQAKLDANHCDYPLLVQGSMPKKELLNTFRESGNAILIGSMSFWEGVDVKGEALSVVVIDKLPFTAPNNPIFAARRKQIENRGGNAFMQLAVPEAIIRMKQGCGRLIRSESDYGVIVVCDDRLFLPHMASIKNALPDFLKTVKRQDAIDMLLNRKALHDRYSV